MVLRSAFGLSAMLTSPRARFVLYALSMSAATRRFSTLLLFWTWRPRNTKLNHQYLLPGFL